MNAPRYVLLGLAHPRSTWFRSTAQWSNSGALPAEFVKCLSPAEVIQRLDSAKPTSALIVDAGLPGVDRDLLTAASERGCAVIVVGNEHAPRDWLALGANVVLRNEFSRAELLDALASYARLVDRGDQAPSGLEQSVIVPLQKASLVMVTGGSGSGVSTTAIAAAQAIASAGRRTVLVDMQLQAEQAMLHDVTTSTGGLQMFVDAHRSSTVSIEHLHEFCLRVPTRGYDLMIGLRRARFWNTIRPVAFAAALNTLLSGYDAVVCDVGADFETEAIGGSLDVEERTLMSRAVAAEADVVLVVAHPSMKGLHTTNRILVDLADMNIPADRLVPVFNQSTKAPRVRAGYTSALAELVSWRDGDHAAISPVHLPIRDVDELVRNNERFPDALTAPLAGALTAIGAFGTAPRAKPDRFQRLKPGSLRTNSAEVGT
jgi:MinD-like ATPase involved in chromosome partitioning or flagellar assembly